MWCGLNVPVFPSHRSFTPLPVYHPPTGLAAGAQGRTALNYAVNCEHIFAALLLLEKGADRQALEVRAQPMCPFQAKR